MRNIIIYLMLHLAALPLFGDAPALSQDDEKAIRDVFEAHYDAWNDHDAKKMALLYASDGDLRTTRNKEGKNQKEIEEVLVDLHSQNMKDAQVEGVIKSIQLVKPDIAFIDGESTITGIQSSNKNTSRLHHHVVFVLVKREGQWKILIGRPF